MRDPSLDERAEAFDNFCADPPLFVLVEHDAGNQHSPHGRFEQQLHNRHEAPTLARSSLTQWLDSTLERHELDTARLLTTELVTNAVLHGDGEIILKAHLNDHRLLVEVVDHGHGFGNTVLRRRSGDPPGLGLTIVDTEATRWGIQARPTQVWFELGLVPESVNIAT